MTRDELLHLQQVLEAAGADRRLIVAVAEADQAWRVHLKAFRAVKRALQEVAIVAESDIAQAESYFSADAKSDSGAGESDFTAAAAGAPDTRKTTARKALLMAHSLTPAARRVGAQLVERFNLATGRCDPSIARLAADLMLDPRSVRRAVTELRDAGLFRVDVQRGRTHRNAYQPDWDALARLALEVEKADSENRTLRTKPDGRVRQNHERESLPAERGESQGARQLSMMLPIDGGRRTAADPIEASIRGKYRDHEPLKAMLAAWWGLSESAQQGFGTLGEFEAWLRAQGPPAARSACG